MSWSSVPDVPRFPASSPALTALRSLPGGAQAVDEGGQHLARKLTFIGNELWAVAADVDVLAEVNHATATSWSVGTRATLRPPRPGDKRLT